MPYREQPMSFSAGPARYPAPDWDAEGTVARVWVPDDETVGWLILQEDRLAWLSAAGPDTPGYPIRQLVEERLRRRLVEGVAAADVWDEILGLTLHTTPQKLPLPALLAEVRDAWDS